jgi:DNA polymerase-3 subunit alpha
MSLFDDEPIQTFKQVNCWTLQQTLQAEKETLGWYISGHPSDEIVQEFKDISVILPTTLASMKVIRMAGMITEWRKILTKRGKPIIIIGLTQGDNSIEMVAFPDRLPNEMTRFGNGDLIFIEGEVSIDPVRQQPRISVQKILSQEEARALYAQALIIPLKIKHQHSFEDMKTLFELNPGHCPVNIRYQDESFSVDLRLGQDWRVHPSGQLLHGLRELLPDTQIDFKYTSKLL